MNRTLTQWIGDRVRALSVHLVDALDRAGYATEDDVDRLMDGLSTVLAG